MKCPGCNSVMSKSKPCKVCGFFIEISKKEKHVKSEQDLVREYADKVVRQKATRGHFDKRFDWHKGMVEKTATKDLWFDTDFFVSLVFQSEAQKYKFLEALKEKFGAEFEEFEQVQILNGLNLAKKMGIALEPESALPYPYTDLELRPLALDSEIFDEKG